MSVLALLLLLTWRRTRAPARAIVALPAVAAACYAVAPHLNAVGVVVACAVGGSAMPLVASRMVAAGLSQDASAARIRLAYTTGWVGGVVVGGAVIQLSTPSGAIIFAAVAQVVLAALVWRTLRVLSASDLKVSSKLIPAPPPPPRGMKALFAGLFLISLGGSFRVGPLAAVVLQQQHVTPGLYAVLVGVTPAAEIVLMTSLARMDPHSSVTLMRIGAVCGLLSFVLILFRSTPAIFVSQAFFAVYVVSATVGALQLLGLTWPDATSVEHTTWTFAFESAANVVGAAIATIAVWILGVQRSFWVPTVTSGIALVVIPLAIRRLRRSSEGLT